VNPGEGTPVDLVGGRLLARNSVLNLAGQGLPMIVAIIAIPYLIEGLGLGRYGVLTLIWMVIGYFGLFDFGLGRALTRVLAERLAEGREEQIPVVAWTALGGMVLLGTAGALLVAAITPWLVTRALSIPVEMQQEALWSFYLLAASLPVVISMVSMQGMLEAKQRFGTMNAIRTPISILTYLAPLAILPFSSSLVPVVLVSLAGRVIGWLVFFAACLRVYPGLLGGFGFSLDAIRPLLRIGGWMTVTNIVSPLMTYLDRFLIGALLSVTAVAYYVTPYEIITKLWLVPTALSGVFFPAFAASYVRDRAYTAYLFGRAISVLLVLLLPVSIALTVLAEDGFTAWLGAEFAAQSAPVFQWLAIGVFVNCIAQMPFLLLQSVGRPDLTARVHLVELPLYLVLLWWALINYGILGAAFAWTVRIVVDTGVMMALCRRILPESRRAVNRSGAALAASVTLMGLASLATSPQGKGIALGLSLLALVIGTWMVLLAEDQRSWIRRRLGDRARGSLSARV